MRDMLDFTLHSWDVVEALGLKNPILVGHSMGGMIAAEMAALAPNDVSRLALICPAGLWLDDHPIVDIFSTAAVRDAGATCSTTRRPARR